MEQIIRDIIKALFRDEMQYVVELIFKMQNTVTSQYDAYQDEILELKLKIGKLERENKELKKGEVKEEPKEAAPEPKDELPFPEGCYINICKKCGFGFSTMKKRERVCPECKKKNKRELMKKYYDEKKSKEGSKRGRKKGSRPAIINKDFDDEINAMIKSTARELAEG